MGLAIYIYIYISVLCYFEAKNEGLGFSLLLSLFSISCCCDYRGLRRSSRVLTVGTNSDEASP